MLLIGLAFIFTNGGNNVGSTINENNVSIVNGKQIIDLTAKGGYTPMKSIAKAGLPTILRFTTSGNFDCSAFVRIPAMKVAQSLALSGTTEIDLGSPKPGLLQGMCGMGMYPFEINFQI